MPDPGFKAFTTSFPRRVSQLITDIAVAPGFDPRNPPIPEPSYVDTKALWDTGASKSMVSADLATQLALVPVGSQVVQHAGGSSPSNTYLVNFRLMNDVRMLGALVTEFPTITGAFGCIVGMDVISVGDLAISHHGGRTTMSFRTPGMAVVDYVKEHDRILFAGVSPNAPCPCGKLQPNGRPVKFKHCHRA